MLNNRLELSLVALPGGSNPVKKRLTIRQVACIDERSADFVEPQGDKEAG